MTPDRSLLWWGLILTGAGVVLIPVTRWVIENSPLYDSWSPYSMVIDGAGWMLVACGVLLLVVDGLLRRSARRRAQPGRRPPRSLRQVALLVTGISSGITLAASLLTWVVEEIDYTHPVGQLGWLAFPAGFVAAGGLIVLLGDVLRSATAPPSGPDAPDPPRPSTPGPLGASRVVPGGRAAVRAYAAYLLVIAVGMVVFTFSLGGWSVISEGIFILSQDLLLLLCAAAFAWGVWRPPKTPGPPGQEPGTDPAQGAPPPSLRHWALALTGGGAGLALTMALAGVLVDRLFNTGVAIGLGIFFLLGLPVAAAGLLLLLVDAVLRRTGRRY